MLSAIFFCHRVNKKEKKYKKRFVAKEKQKRSRYVKEEIIKTLEEKIKHLENKIQQLQQEMIEKTKIKNTRFKIYEPESYSQKNMTGTHRTSLHHLTSTSKYKRMSSLQHLPPHHRRVSSSLFPKLPNCMNRQFSGPVLGTLSKSNQLDKLCIQRRQSAPTEINTGRKSVSLSDKQSMQNPMTEPLKHIIRNYLLSCPTPSLPQSQSEQQPTQPFLKNHLSYEELVQKASSEPKSSHGSHGQKENKSSEDTTSSCEEPCE